MENNIKIKLYKPKSLDEIRLNYTTILAKILSEKIPNNSIDNFIEKMETIYAEEISACECNIMKGEKNEYGCDLHKKV